MIFLLILFILILFIVWVNYIVYQVYGKSLSKETYNKFLNLDFTEFKFNHNLLYTKPFIGIIFVPFIPIVFKYYIYSEGVVPIWSKLHKKIKNHYKNNK